VSFPLVSFVDDPQILDKQFVAQNLPDNFHYIATRHDLLDF